MQVGNGLIEVAVLGPQQFERCAQFVIFHVLRLIVTTGARLGPLSDVRW